MYVFLIHFVYIQYIYIICIYIHTYLHTHEVHTILIIKPGTWHLILANHFKCFRFPVANASLENISQAEAAVIGPAYNNMSFLVVAAKNPSLDFKGFVLLYQFTGRPPPVEVFFFFYRCVPSFPFSNLSIWGLLQYGSQAAIETAGGNESNTIDHLAITKRMCHDLSESRFVACRTLETSKTI